MENPKIKFYVEKNSFWVHSASLLLALAAVFQFIGCWGLWNDRWTVLTQLLAPLGSFLLFVLVLNLLGKQALWLTALPFLGGVAFYGYHAWTAEDKLLMVIGITFCVLAAVLYLGTVFALIRTKWLLVPLFALPFCYRAFYRDVLLLQDLENPVRFSDGMREMSLLCVLLALTLLALGMKRLVRERRQKPGKAEAPVESAPVESAPVVIPPPPVNSPFAPVEPAPTAPAESAPAEPSAAESETAAEKSGDNGES